MSIDLDVIDRVIDIAASPETVFTLLTDPEQYVRWKGTTARLDPRRGGAFDVGFAGGGRVIGEYLEVVPNRRVVFTWGWDSPEAVVGPGGSTVEIDLEPKAKARQFYTDVPRLEDELHAGEQLHVRRH